MPDSLAISESSAATPTVAKKKKPRKPDITADIARHHLAYNKHTGLLTWNRDRSRTAKAGDEAGCQTSNGAIIVGIEGRMYSAARVIWLMVTGEWPRGRLRFKDDDPRNLRWNNLVERRDLLSLNHTAVYQRRYRKIKALAMRRINASRTDTVTYQTASQGEAQAMLRRYMDMVLDDLLRNDAPDPSER